MKKRKLLFTLLALGLGAFLGGSGAMAQSGGWEVVYAQTQTDSDDWTAITAGSTTGMTLGASGTTTYYYVKGNYNFGSATNYGVSGLKIQGTVYLYVPYGKTITCVGGHATGATGAGAGIELAAGTPTNTLYIIGGGTVNATGGNAANGGNGEAGDDAYLINSNTILGGSGGDGGNGGGGAGAGIGTRGGTGGTHGTGGQRTGSTGDEKTQYGVDGNPGNAGSSAGAMGTLYVANGTTVNATGGSKGSNGTRGEAGRTACEHPSSNIYFASGGGGGGAGGYGGAASNIGTGGPGGGGGGGGAAGNVAWSTYSGTLNPWYRAGAFGGEGGQNANADDEYDYAPDGADQELKYPNDAYYQYDLRSSYNTNDDGGYENGNGRHQGGAPGAKGPYPSSAGTQTAGDLTYNITYIPIKTNINGKNGSTLYSLTVTYSPSAATDVVLPKNKDGFQWVLTTYGKSCAPGATVSEFATATKAYYGGSYTEEALRTIVLGHVYGDLVFHEVPTRLNITNTGNNQQELAEWMAVEYPVTVRLEDRTLYRDNHWNTLCLPFNMTSAQIAASNLAGATIYKMNETVSGYYPSGYVNKEGYQVKDYGYPVLLFWFDNVDVTATGTVLQAGKPYLVKWAEKDTFTADGNYMDNTNNGNTRHELDFEGMTITQTVGGSWTGAGTTNGNIIFQGTLSQSATLQKDDKTRLVLGVRDGKDKLYYPSKNMNVGACRGYFIIPEAAANDLSTSNAPQMVMGFGDGETTDIRVLNVTPESRNDGAIYNLSGQRLNALQKGVNIVNGKKVIIK